MTASPQLLDGVSVFGPALLVSLGLIWALLLVTALLLAAANGRDTEAVQIKD